MIKQESAQLSPLRRRARHQNIKIKFQLFCVFTYSLLSTRRLLPRIQRSLLASRSDSNNVRISPSRTGPLTFLISCLFCSFRNSTLTCVHCPWDPVLPRTFTTLARTIGFSMLSICFILLHNHARRTALVPIAVLYWTCRSLPTWTTQEPHADQMSSWQCSKKERGRKRVERARGRC